MYLYLVQHAVAKSEEEDPSRPLSEKGMSDVTRMASYVQRLRITVAQIVHSPKLRAKQTARVLSDYLKPAEGVLESAGLSPVDPPDIWAARLRETASDTMLVGHLPHLGRLASLLLCGDADKNPVAFKMAGVVCLKRDEAGVWSIQWMLTPEMIEDDRGGGYACDSL